MKWYMSDKMLGEGARQVVTVWGVTWKQGHGCDYLSRPTHQTSEHMKQGKSSKPKGFHVP